MEFYQSSMHRFFISVEPSTPADKFLCLLVKTCLNASVGARLHPQNGREIHSLLSRHFFATWYFSGTTSVNSPLSPGLFQKIASTHHSSFMMPSWRLLQLKMARKNTYKHNTYRPLAFVIVCLRNYIQIRWRITKASAPSKIKQKYLA